MNGDRHERRQFFRGKARPGRVLTVRFCAAGQADDPSRWVTAETTDIGVGGAFIACPAAPPVGATLTVELTLPSTDRTFAIPAVVRWLAAAGGMGVQFVGVDVDVLLELNDYFATLTEI